MLFSTAALNQLYKLHNRDHNYRKANGDAVFQCADVFEAESIRNAREMN